MIAFVRVACVKPGKQGAAMTFAKEISAFLKGSYHLDMEILRPVGGNPYRVAWSTRYADMAAMETITTKMLADPNSTASRSVLILLFFLHDLAARASGQGFGQGDGEDFPYGRDGVSDVPFGPDRRV